MTEEEIRDALVEALKHRQGFVITDAEAFVDGILMPAINAAVTA